MTATQTMEYWEQISYGLTVDALAEHPETERRSQRKVESVLTNSGLNFGHYSDQEQS